MSKGTDTKTAIRRKASRVKAMRIAEANILGQKVNHKVKDILSKYPDIGDKIEEFVKSNTVGADAWRRTGILTFDGNIKNTQKVTYEKIRKHLEQVYGRHFSYGTAVRLCVAGNKRRKSSQRYKAIAQITTRRARKGFQLRYNPDFHWCNAFYCGLNILQFKMLGILIGMMPQGFVLIPLLHINSTHLKQSPART